MATLAQPPDQPSSHVVQTGDTYWSIAAQAYDDPLAWRVIANANSGPGTTPQALWIGTTLRIPLPGPGTGRHRSPAPGTDAQQPTPGTDSTGTDAQQPTPGTDSPGAGAKPVADTGGSQSATAGLAARVIDVAKAQIGKDYVWGGESPAEGGFDCSGLVQYAYSRIGIHLPRTTWAQAGAGHAVTLADLQPGDLIFSNGGGHVSLAIGGGQVVEAANPRVDIRIADLPRGITAIRRVLPDAPSSTPVHPPTSVAGLQNLARSIVGAAQSDCFNRIVEHESSWRPFVWGDHGAAYGLMQANPAAKYATVGADWRTNPATQIRWGLAYMNSRYGSPCAAWSWWSTHHWY